MWDRNNKAHVDRLRDSLKFSRGQMQTYRERVKSALAEYAGTAYGPEVRAAKDYINPLARAVDTFADRLMPDDPRVSVAPTSLSSPDTNHSRYLRPAGVKLESHMNMRLKRERIGRSLHTAVVQSLFGLGAVKVGLKPEGEFVVDAYGVTIEKTGPFIEPILMEDLLVDMTARSPDPFAAGYVGHRYTAWQDTIEADPSFDPDAVKRLYNAGEYGSAKDKLSSIGANVNDDAPYMPTVELWEVFLPREQLLITYGGCEFENILKVVEWTGPERGPIHNLWLRTVPGNAMPRGIALDWVENSKLQNIIYRKIADQAKEQKTIYLVPAGEDGDGKRIYEAADGDALSVNNTQAVQQVRYGGPDQQMMGFKAWLDADFSTEAGNLNIMAGLSQQSDTATQDSILNANSSRLVETLSKAVIAWTKNVLSDYAWYLWTDPYSSFPGEQYIPGYGSMQTVLSPEERTADFFEYSLDVEPYSITHQTPAAKIAALDQTLQQIVLPGLPYMQQNGMSLDWAELIKLRARYLGMPDLERIITAQGVPMDAGSGQPPEQRKPMGGPPREYRRTSVNGNAQQSPQMQAVESMGSGKEMAG